MTPAQLATKLWGFGCRASSSDAKSRIDHELFQGWDLRRVGHAVLAASLAQFDLIEEAKAAVDNYLEIISDETISKLRFLPFKNHTDAHRLEEGLQKACLPE